AKQLANQLKFKSYVKVLPPFATTVFKNVVADFAMEIIQSFTEADCLIAYKSNQYKCPVLSNDSDFFIYNLKYGYIPFDTLCLSKRDLQNLCCRSEFSNDKAVSCMIYSVENLLKLFPGLDAGLLPFFATLTGNDYTFKHISKPQVKRKSKLRATNNHCLMIGLLSFLCNKSLNQAIESVLSFIKLDQREGLRSMINNSLIMYDERRFLVQTLDELTINSDDKDQIPLKLKLPGWVVDRFEKLRIHPIVIQLFTNREVFLPCLIEDPGSHSILDCCQKINNATYHLILSFSKSIVEDGQHLSIIEWGTKNLHQFKREVCLDNNFPFYLPHFNDMGEISVIERRNYVYRVIDFEEAELQNKLDNFPPNVQLFVLALHYWIVESEKKKTDAKILDSLIVSAFLRMNMAQDSETVQFWNASEFSLKAYSNEYSCKEVFRSYDKLKSSPSDKFLRTDLWILHELSRFQAVLYSLNLLNAVLMEPFQALRIENLYSGTSIYSFIKSSENCCDFMTSLSKIGICGSHCGLLSKLVNFRDSLLDILPKNLFRSCDNVMKKNKRSSLKSKMETRRLTANKFDVLFQHAHLRFEYVYRLSLRTKTFLID
uniref:Asteroid domain-containing protein n=1 Tax=Romanomermis culicivorax TaxID=13658 RepID=A0A915K5C2_ROMCU